MLMVIIQQTPSVRVEEKRMNFRPIEYMYSILLLDGHCNHFRFSQNLFATFFLSKVNKLYQIKFLGIFSF